MRHLEKLQEALGDGRLWKFTGEVVDHGTPVWYCACGHPIRFEYIIRHSETGDICGLGSECIHYFKDANPDTFLALDKAVKAHRKAKAQAALEAAVNEYGNSWADKHSRLTQAYKWFEDRSIYAPKELWKAVASEKFVMPLVCPVQLTGKAKAKWYKDAIEKADIILEEARAEAKRILSKSEKTA